MQLETLQVFCDLAELLSFSKTAEKNYLSQSAVSQQLAQLELQYKCQLINRKKRPIELTREGRLLYKTAKQIVEMYDNFKTELQNYRSASAKRINVAAIFSIGMHTLPDYIKKFMTAYPNIHVHVEYFGAERIYELVLSNNIDIGLVAVPHKDRRLDVYDFQHESLVLVCSPNHILASRDEMDIREVHFERFIGFEKDIPTREWIDSIFARHNLIVRPAMEFDNIETIKRAIEINSGISILPATAIFSELAAGTLRQIKLTNDDLYRPTGIIVKKNRTLSLAAKYFIELLRKK
ncbi:MAG: LysR family transcriptional regulator [Phycisphaerae bacterium]|nr:LysR family transcriptional regulator [Phycisphaerae bacterium]